LVGAAVLVQAGAGTALAGFRLHVPGMLLQVLGGWAALRLLALRQD
jgi:hypothetical protein